MKKFSFKNDYPKIWNCIFQRKLKRKWIIIFYLIFLFNNIFLEKKISNYMIKAPVKILLQKIFIFSKSQKFNSLKQNLKSYQS